MKEDKFLAELSERMARENEEVEMTLEELRKAAIRVLPRSGKSVKEVRKMELWADGKRCARLPVMTSEEKCRVALRNMARFRWEPHYVFWRNVYNHCKQRLSVKEKAGKLTAISNPASDNHDDFPAA